MDYSFNVYNKLAASGIVMAIDHYLNQKAGTPVVICIGSILRSGTVSVRSAAPYSANVKLRTYLFTEH